MRRLLSPVWGIRGCAVTLDDADSVTPGTKLGRYTVLRRLGVGGMGEVYLAEAEGAANFTKQVAIKRILPHLARNTESVAKFIDEAQLMVQLHHGNIVTVIELAEEAGELFLVTEYLPGRDLKTVIRALRSQSRNMPPELALLLIRQVCAGLDYAHRKQGADGLPLGIVHRDVSPSNVLLGAEGEVKLCDFGIARGRGLLHQSISGTLQGKFIYMSPEQAEGGHLDSRSDLFSTGLVLYELLCGVRPFEGESETETLRLVRDGQIPSIAHYLPDLDPQLVQIVMTGLEKDPARRYQTADEFGRAISHYLALSESAVSPATLSRFLETLFPDGVVLTAEERPQSLDDALNVQLNALTPHPAALEMTRTHTGPLATPVPLRASPPPPSTPPATPESYATNDGEPVSHVTVVAPAKGRKTMLFLGLTLGVAASLASVFWADNPLGGTLTVKVSPEAAQKVRITVDDVPLTQGERLRAGRRYKICASADTYRDACIRPQLSVGDNLFTIKLEPQPSIDPRIIPAGLKARILIDQAEISRVPRFVTADRTYTVCAEVKGYSATPKCRIVEAKSGTYQPEFTFKPLTEPVAQTPVAQSEPAVDKPKATPHRKKPRPSARSTEVSLDSIPVATVWEGDRKLGQTPLSLKIGQDARRLRLTAKRFAATPVTLRPGQRGRLPTVYLNRPAYLTLRAHPGASEIWLNGEKVGTGSLYRFPTEPGRHSLEVRYYRGGNLVAKAERTLNLIPGEVKHIKEPITLEVAPRTDEPKE